MKQEIEVVVFEDDSCEYNIPGNPQEFLAWWMEKFSLIPNEYQNTAHVSFETCQDYDTTRLEVQVWYTRLETDEEESARIKKEIEQKKCIEAQELRQFEKLKAKYNL